VDAEQKKVLLASGESLSYDVLSINAGSYVPRTLVTGDGRDIFAAKPIESLLEAQARLLEMLEGKAARVGVIGGGPAAVEIAGNIWRLAKDQGEHRPLIQVFSGDPLMARFHAGVRRRVAASLKRRGIEVLENALVREVSTGEITLTNGDTHAADLIFLALGVLPSPIFKDSGLPTGPDGGLRVNAYLQCPQYPAIFGGGDCIYFEPRPLDKVGVYAVRQNPILFHNLEASLAQTALKPFDPGGDYLLIFNLGDGTGVLQKNWFIMGGRPAFLIKDYIDRKFMKRFQALE
jgi:NADH dehydrogenase FAD-containing subunit